MNTNKFDTASQGCQNNFNNCNSKRTMAFEHKEGQGSIFRNEKQNDRQPDYKGTIVIGGTTYEIAGWVKKSQKGTSYMSLQASVPKKRKEQPSASTQEMMSRASDNFEKRDMPF